MYRFILYSITLTWWIVFTEKKEGNYYCLANLVLVLTVVHNWLCV